MRKQKYETSWHHVGKWYNELVDRRGHYYHEHIILPNALRLLKLSKDSSLLDLACGQGVLARQIPKDVHYQGVDAARSLIEFAQKGDNNSNHRYTIGDITRSLPINKRDFSHATIILALQNIENPASAFNNCANYLSINGRLLIVLNHPCFRIPRQSSWEIDEKNKLQYRRINRYLSPLKIPITIHPGKRQSSPLTWSFHYPLSSYSLFLKDAGFVIETIEEWASDKESVGKAARMENRGRSEFPLFLAMVAVKR